MAAEVVTEVAAAARAAAAAEVNPGYGGPTQRQS